MASTPRLRVSRNPLAYDHLLSGSSLDHLPELSATTAALTENSDNNDRDDDQESTPKMSTTMTLQGPSGTNAARLRAVLARTASPSKSIPMPLPSSQSSEHESDFEPPNSTSELTHSRASIKDIFLWALRDPGDTPQKEKIRPRRNSIDTSEVEASPRVQHRRAQNKGNKKSLSDEEIDPAKSSEASFRSSQAATYDVLRERLMKTYTQPNDLHISHPMHQNSIPDDDHNTANFLRSTNDMTNTPPTATSTPQQSLRMSVDSHFPSQSNLLDQDSEMQRAFEAFDNDEPEASGQRQADDHPSSTSTLAREQQKRPSSQTSRDWHSTSHETSSSDASDQFLKREKEWNRPRTPTRAPEKSRQSPQLQFSSGSVSMEIPPGKVHLVRKPTTENELKSSKGSVILTVNASGINLVQALHVQGQV
ncbi:hypothetical protein H0H87_011659 [Tephrocybe sp. NHM501043]|nr:hypothetical protein H0H87_011659 [Tephrocybe sp. NHM501043]